MKLLYGRDFHKTRLTQEEEKSCEKAVEQFMHDPFHPGLCYERLGSGLKQNHCSIRASGELRVILAIEPSFNSPEVVVLANRGHHDAMYSWAERRHYFTSSDEATSDYALSPDQSTLGAAPWNGLLNFDEWQLFPHPDQEPLIKRQYASEARIRGAAGTGKTVVALHRARELGHRYAGEKVLFTTFSKSLVRDLAQRYNQLPNPALNVDFRNIDSLAYETLEIRGERVTEKRVDEAFDHAYQAVIPGTQLERCSQDYLKDEIVKVIKGRGAVREDYLDTDRFERIGRRRKFTRTDRELCWELREQWDNRMRAAQVPNYADRLLYARDRANEREAGIYRAAIVDEAQDMTLVGMQLVRALVVGHPENPMPTDGLLILDDAAQRIYAGGFRLSWAGLRVAGRSEILQTNYRNVQPIMEAAKAVRGDSLPIREDGDDGAAQSVQYENEHGNPPTFTMVGDKAEIPTIAKTIKKLSDEENFDYNTIAVLTRGNTEAELIKTTLEKKFGIPCVLLKRLRDTAQLGTRVRVGTFDRSKGMEFRAVLIPRLGASIFPKAEDSDDNQPALPGLDEEPRVLTEEEREARQLDLDRLYVGMTRARERLYLIADEPPGTEIQRALDKDLIQSQRVG